MRNILCDSQKSRGDVCENKSLAGDFFRLAAGDVRTIPVPVVWPLRGWLLSISSSACHKMAVVSIPNCSVIDHWHFAAYGMDSFSTVLCVDCQRAAAERAGHDLHWPLRPLVSDSAGISRRHGRGLAERRGGDSLSTWRGAALW